MPIFFILIVLSLIIYRMINRAEFYNYKFVIKQITSPLVSSLIVLKNGLGGLILIAFFVLSLTSPSSAEYSPKQPSINLDDVESGQLLMRSGNDLSSAILLSSDITDQIGGWATNSVGQSYGSGYSLNVLQEWMEKTV